MDAKGRVSRERAQRAQKRFFTEGNHKAFGVAGKGNEGEFDHGFTRMNADGKVRG